MYLYLHCTWGDWQKQVTDITVGCHPYDLDVISC